MMKQHVDRDRFEAIAGETTRKSALYADSACFPAAAAFALVAVPLWLAAFSGWIAVPSRYWHAHEMLFGYTLMVLAGYLVARISRGTLLLLVTLWLAARVAAFMGGAGSALAITLDLAFVFGVTAPTAWRFLRAAKKVQNRVFAPLLLAIFGCDAVYQLGALTGSPGLQFGALLGAVDLYASLLVLMGGRVLPAAIAGHYYRAGRVLEVRVQPALEKLVIVCLGAMLALDLFPNARPFAGMFAIAAALITAIRATRWRLWTVLDQPHLWPLGLGYFWLVPGLALKGCAQIWGGAALGSALHAITIGAVGTLTLVMMARTRLQRSRRPLRRFGDIAVAALLLSGAAVLRIVFPAAGVYSMPVLWTAGVLWVLAFGLLLRRLVMTARAFATS